MDQNPIRYQTVRLIGKLLHPLTESNLTMLGISLANFKRLEREGYFPFKRKMVGTSVRYRNTDLTRYILSHDDTGE